MLCQAQTTHCHLSPSTRVPRCIGHVKEITAFATPLHSQAPPPLPGTVRTPPSQLDCSHHRPPICPPPDLPSQARRQESGRSRVIYRASRSCRLSFPCHGLRTRYSIYTAYSPSRPPARHGRLDEPAAADLCPRCGSRSVTRRDHPLCQLDAGREQRLVSEHPAAIEGIDEQGGQSRDARPCT